MSNSIDEFLARLPAKTDGPSDEWNPPHCGDLALEIKRDGSWWYAGTPMQRERLIGLFASIMRREDDAYVLVNPVEKLRITVEDVPFQVQLVERRGDAIFMATDYAGGYTLNATHFMELRDYQGTLVPYFYLRHGLYARAARNVFYELVNMAVEQDGVMGVNSAGQFWPLERQE